MIRNGKPAQIKANPFPNIKTGYKLTLKSFFTLKHDLNNQLIFLAAS